jgi:hypothetical protein
MTPWIWNSSVQTWFKAAIVSDCDQMIICISQAIAESANEQVHFAVQAERQG